MKQIRNWTSVKSTSLVQSSRKILVYLPKMIFEVYGFYMTYGSVQALRSQGKDKCTGVRRNENMNFVIFAIIAMHII